MPDLEPSGSIPLSIAAVVLVCAAAIGLGQLVMRTPSRANPFDALLIEFAVGLNSLGFVGVVCGQLGLFSKGQCVWLLVTFAIAGLMAKWWRRQGRSGRRPDVRRRIDRRVLFVPAVVLFVTLGPALCYPFAWDELVYHCVLPRRWFMDGALLVYRDLPYSGFPSIGEIIFWLAAPIESVITPRLLVWLCWTTGLVCLFRILRRRVSDTAAVLLTVALALNETLLVVSANCYVESIMLLDVAALLLALDARERRRWSAAMHAGILGVIAGGAAAIKLTGIAVLFVPLLWYCGEVVFHRRLRRETMYRCGVFAIVYFAFVLPFYLRPWLATGNPFYPYFGEWFSNGATLLEMSRFHHEIGRFKFGVNGVIGFFSAPLLLAFRPENYDGEFGWQLLVFVALAGIALTAWARRNLRPLLLWPLSVSLGFYVFWYFTSQQARFAIPYLVALGMMAAIGLRLLDPNRRSIALMALMATVAFSIPWRKADFYTASWRTVFGGLSSSEYVNYGTRGVYLPLIEAVNRVTSVDDTIFLIYEHRGFYIPRRYEIATPMFQPGPFSPPDQFADGAEILRVLDERGVTHVIIAKVNPGPDDAPGWIERQQPFLRGIGQCVQQGRLRPRWESPEYVLLEVHFR